jgi:integrase
MAIPPSPRATALTNWPKPVVERLLAAVHSLKHRAMVMVAYGAGLRASELCALTPARHR